MPAYYLCSECLAADGVLTRLFRGATPGSAQFCDPTNPTAFHCPADRGHDPGACPPILITRVPRYVAVLTRSRGISPERRAQLGELAERVQYALAEIFEAFSVIGERRDAGQDLEWSHDQRRTLARIPYGWRLNGFS